MATVKIPKQSISGKNIYIVVTSAGRIEKIAEMTDELIANGANIFIFPTEKALNLIDPLKKYSDRIYKDFNWHGPRRSIPQEDIVIVAPCTFNTFNKMSLGIADNYPTTLIANAIGKRKRIIIIPSLNKDVWNHPVTMESVKRLESWGVIIIWPETTNGKVSMMDYKKALDRLYIEESKIIFDSEQVISPEITNLLVESRNKYFQNFVDLGKIQEREGTNSFANGNYSLKIDVNWALITATGSKSGNLSPEDLTLIRLDTLDKVVWAGAKMPSCDTPMHIIYYRDTSAQAIVHSHCSKMTYSDDLEIYKTPEYVRYGRFDSVEQSVSLLLKNDGFVILKFHGEVGIGETLLDAYSKIKHYFELICKNDKAE